MSRVWISRAEALERLDVKPQTLYAYVSRQRVAARADPEHPRKSLYALDDIERLSQRTPGRGNPALSAPPRVLSGGPVGRGEAVLDTEISVTFNGRPHYRRHDALSLSERENFETVATLLWRDENPTPFAAIKPRPDVNFPGSPRTRLWGVLSRRLEEDAIHDPHAPRNLPSEAASILNEMVDGVTNGGPRLFLHQRLARAWKVYNLQDVDLLRRALILSADNGLDEATLAARVAAAAHGPLAASVIAACATVTGAGLGGRIMRAESYVTQARRQGNAHLAAETVLKQGQELPGFEANQSESDALRAESLMAAAAHMGDDLKAIWQAGEDITGRPVGFTLALALVGRHLDLPREAPFTLYAIGRTAGWLAHAIEQMEAKSSPHVRLRYIGEPPLVSPDPVG